MLFKESILSSLTKIWFVEVWSTKLVCKRVKMSYQDDSDEFDFESDVESSEDTPTVNCANCKQLIYEDAQQCPYCLEYTSIESPDHLSSSTKTVIWLLILSLVLPTLVFAASVLLKKWPMQSVRAGAYNHADHKFRKPRQTQKGQSAATLQKECIQSKESPK